MLALAITRRRAHGLATALGCWLGIAALGVAPGCASRTAEFRPAGSGADADARGMSAVYYELVKGDQNWGDAKVWSRGAAPRGPVDAGLALHAGLRLRNDSQDALELLLDRVSIELEPVEGDLLVIDDPLEVSGETTIPPESQERIELRFAVPEGLDVDDIRGFELNWAVRTPKGLYTESTPFTRSGRDDGCPWWPCGVHSYWGYYPYYPYYYSPGWHRWYY